MKHNVLTRKITPSRMTGVKLGRSWVALNSGWNGVKSLVIRRGLVAPGVMWYSLGREGSSQSSSSSSNLFILILF